MENPEGMPSVEKPSRGEISKGPIGAETEGRVHGGKAPVPRGRSPRPEQGLEPQAELDTAVNGVLKEGANALASNFSRRGVPAGDRPLDPPAMSHEPRRIDEGEDSPERRRTDGQQKRDEAPEQAVPVEGLHEGKQPEGGQQTLRKALRVLIAKPGFVQVTVQLKQGHLRIPDVGGKRMTPHPVITACQTHVDERF